MRHLGSLLAGLVVAPLAWVLIAAGQPRTAQVFVRWSGSDTVYTGDLLRPLGLLAAAGLLIGLVLALRLSPVGPLVAGLAYLGVYGFAFIDPFRVLDLLPQINLRGYRIDTTVPFTNGTMALIGVALVVAALSRRRWQRWPSAAGAGAGADAAGPPEAPVSPTPAAVTGEQPQPEVPPAVGPLPPVAAGPLWPATAAAGQTTSDLMMSPGTAEDLPRRTPPKRPESPAQPDARAWNEQPGGPVDGWPMQDGWPEPKPVSWPGAGPVIPGPRHAAADDDRPGPIEPTFRFAPSGPPDDDAPSYAADEGDRPRPAQRPQGPAAGSMESAGSSDAVTPAQGTPPLGPQRAGPPQAATDGETTQPLSVPAQSGQPQSGPQAPPPQATPPQSGPPQAPPPQTAPPPAAPPQSGSPQSGPPQSGPPQAPPPQSAPPRGGTPPGAPTEGGPANVPPQQAAPPQREPAPAAPPQAAPAPGPQSPAPDGGPEQNSDPPPPSPWAGPPRPTQE